MTNTPKPEVAIKRELVGNRDNLKMYFRYNDKLLTIIRTIGKFKWSPKMRCWYGPFSPENLKAVRVAFQEVATLIEDVSIYNAPIPNQYRDKPEVSDVQNERIQAYEKYLIGKRYSKSTVLTYTSFIADFLRYLGDKSIRDISNRDV